MPLECDFLHALDGLLSWSHEAPGEDILLRSNFWRTNKRRNIFLQSKHVFLQTSNTVVYSCPLNIFKRDCSLTEPQETATAIRISAPIPFLIPLSTTYLFKSIQMLQPLQLHRDLTMGPQVYFWIFLVGPEHVGSSAVQTLMFDLFSGECLKMLPVSIHCEMESRDILSGCSNSFPIPAFLLLLDIVQCLSKSHILDVLLWRLYKLLYLLLVVVVSVVVVPVVACPLLSCHRC